MEIFDQKQWLSWLVRIRLIIIAFLLGLQLIIQQIGSLQRLTVVRVPLRYFLTTLIFWALLDLIFYFLLQTNADLRLQACLQVTLDSVMVTLVVYFTGGLDSYFYFLFPVTILMGSMVLAQGGAYLVATLCFVQAWLVLEGPYYGLFPSYGVAYPDLSTLRLRIVTNALAFLAVAYLAARLAESLRKTGVQLRDQAGKLEDLRAMNHEILESMRGGLITTDLQGRILLLNTPGAEILNTSFPSVAGRPLGTLFPSLADEGRPDLLPPRREVLWRDAAGTEKYLGFSVAPLSRGGQAAGYVYNFQDVTLIRELQRRVQLKDRMAAIGRMAAAIAHEIRNPLASIAGSVKLFSGMVNLSQDQERLIGIVLKESERLNGIITNFLFYAREKNFQFARVNVAEILEETLTLLQNNPRVDARYRIERRFPGEPVWAALDTDRMRQVFWNLGDNALKAMSAGGVLQVQLATAGEHLQIRFRDTGVGISAQQAEKMFEPFQSEFEGGTGLGLAIAYQIVQAHQGTIRAEPAARGCTIVVELPLLAEPAPAAVPALTAHG